MFIMCNVDKNKNDLSILIPRPLFDDVKRRSSVTCLSKTSCSLNTTNAFICNGKQILYALKPLQGLKNKCFSFTKKKEEETLLTLVFIDLVDKVWSRLCYSVQLSSVNFTTLDKFLLQITWNNNKFFLTMETLTKYSPNCKSFIGISKRCHAVVFPI